MEQNMSCENLNNFHWKNKLEDVDSLSTETLIDKNAAWKKLHIQLTTEPHRIKRIWYWAAACLLLSLIIPLILTNKTSNSLVKNHSQIKSKKITDAEPGSKKENTIATIPFPPIKKNKTLQSFLQVHSKIIFSNNAVKKEETVTADFSDNKIIKQEIIMLHSVIDSLAVTKLTVPPVKRKLEVIHINELGDPVEEIPNLVRNSEHHSFEFKLINQEVYTSPSLPSNNSGFTLSKTQIVPSN